MLKDISVAVVVPAYNEEKHIARTLTTIPDYVDHIIVVNDGSSDGTREVIEEIQKKDSRIFPINHDINQGLGRSLIDGYLQSRDMGVVVTGVMAGDGQMHPDDLSAVLAPILEGEADYAKGNRLLHSEVAHRMPLHRLVGNSGLTFLTKFATGYWHVIDPQCGYTAISKRGLDAIPIERMTKGYGYNADILNMLNVKNFRVADVKVRPVYGDEVSKIKLYKYIPSVSWLLLRLFFRRLVKKYVVRNFNPLCLSYLVGLFLLVFGTVPFSARLFYMYNKTGEFPQTTLLCLMFVTITGIQILLSAVHYDMEDNRHLCVHAYE